MATPKIPPLGLYPHTLPIICITECVSFSVGQLLQSDRRSKISEIDLEVQRNVTRNRVVVVKGYNVSGYVRQTAVKIFLLPFPVQTVEISMVEIELCTPPNYQPLLQFKLPRQKR